MFQTALPNLHPVVVHLPVVLIPLALALELVSLARTRRAELERWAAGAWVLAALATGGAWLAGREAADGLVDVPARAQAAIGEHADLATALLIGVSCVALLRVVASWQRGAGWTRPLRGLLALVEVAGVGLLLVTADHGGALVYTHGLGVVAAAPVEAEPVDTADVEEGVEVGPAALTLDDDLYAWQGAPFEGSAELPAWLAAEPVRSVELQGAVVPVDGRQLLLFDRSFDDVQLNAWLDLSGYQGELSLLHHVGDDAAGAFVLDTDGAARLATLGVDGEVLDSGATGLSGQVALAVSAAGHHLKGIVDGEIVAHGHTEPLPAGRVGLLFDGQGVVVIRRVEAVPLDE